MGMGHKVTFRCGDSLISELDKYAAAKGVDRGAAIRGLLEGALLAESEGAYAGLIASSVRSELAAWLARSGMDAAAMREMREAVGAAFGCRPTTPPSAAAAPWTNGSPAPSTAPPTPRAARSRGRFPWLHGKACLSPRGSS